MSRDGSVTGYGFKLSFNLEKIAITLDFEPFSQDGVQGDLKNDGLTKARRSDCQKSPWMGVSTTHDDQLPSGRPGRDAICVAVDCHRIAHLTSGR